MVIADVPTTLDPTPYLKDGPLGLIFFAVALTVLVALSSLGLNLWYENLRGKRHAESEEERDRSQMAAVDRSTDALLKVSKQYASLLERLDNHIAVDERFSQRMDATLTRIEGVLGGLGK